MPPGARPQLPIGILRAAVIGSVNGYPWVNVFHLKLTTDGSEDTSTIAAVLAALLSNYAGKFKVLYPSTWQVEKAEGTYRKSTGISLRDEAITTTAGTVAGTTCLPLNVSIGIGWRTNLYYRGGHPRTYLASCPANQVADARYLAGTFRATVQTQANDFLALVNAQSTTHVTKVDLGTVSYSSGGLWRATPLFIPYVAAIVDRRIDSQRRRLGRDQ